MFVVDEVEVEEVDEVVLLVVDKLLITLGVPVVLSITDIIQLCALKTVTIKRAGMISDTTKNTKLNGGLESCAPVSTKINTQCRRNASEPNKVSL
jgi:hypothetical protein